MSQQRQKALHDFISCTILSKLYSFHLYSHRHTRQGTLFPYLGRTAHRRLIQGIFACMLLRSQNSLNEFEIAFKRFSIRENPVAFSSFIKDQPFLLLRLTFRWIHLNSFVYIIVYIFILVHMRVVFAEEISTQQVSCIIAIDPYVQNSHHLVRH